MSRAKNKNQATQQSEPARSAARADTVLVRKNNGEFLSTSSQVAERLVGSGRAMYAEPGEVERITQRLAQRGANKRGPADVNKEENS